MAFITCFVLTLLVLSIECAVIRLQDIPLNEKLSMKLVIKEDPHHNGAKVASILLDIEDMEINIEKDNFPKKLVHKYVKPTGDFVPDFGHRAGIENGKCPLGTVRRGQLCI